MFCRGRTLTRFPHFFVELAAQRGLYRIRYCGRLPSTLDLSNLYRVRFYQSAVPQKKALCLDRLQGISRYLAVQLQVGVHQHLQCGLHFEGNSLSLFRRSKIPQDCGLLARLHNRLSHLSVHIKQFSHIRP